MSAMLQPQIILLKEGTDTSQGKAQLISNINACTAVADVVRTTLGPRGMDKLIHDDKGNVTISNDGATIMKLLDIVHPAAKILVDIAKSQDSEVGDGTTTVVLLAGEFLKEAKPFIEDGVHPQNLIRSYRTACYLAIEKIKELAVSIEGKSLEEKKSLLAKCAATTLSSKLIGGEKEFFASMVVDAVIAIGNEDRLSMIGIKKVPGGTMRDSFLVNGVAFKKTFSYAGFEQQPKKFLNPKILLLNIELELKSEKENAEIRLSDPSQYQSIVDAEWNIIYDKLDKCVQSGAKVVLSRLAIGDLATQYFADRDIFCAGRVAEEDLKRVAAATGGTVQTSVNNVIDEVLGTCEVFEERQVGNERFNIFNGCPSGRTATIVLRGGADQFIEEAERSLHDAIMIVRRALKNSTVVAGGGAIDMEISRYLRQHARTIAGKSQLFINSYAKALEVIPRQLCDNAGFDATDVLNKLRQKHALQSGEGAPYGVDINTGGIADSFANFVWEPAVVKINAINAATEAACLILSVDETVKNPKSESAQGEATASAMAGRVFGMVQIELYNLRAESSRFKSSVVGYLISEGTEAVEGLSLDVSAEEDAIVIRTEAFAKMINLRLLKINSVRFSTACYDKFSEELRWLCWHRCPLQVLPPNLGLDKLVVLDMQFSNFKKVWKGLKFLNRLEILDLSYSIYLAETPDFSRCTSLKRLQLEGCTSLTKVHQSIGNLENLVLLNLAECNNLRELPDGICNLTSLQTLSVNGCSRFSCFPEHLGRLEALTELHANGCGITQLPTSFGLLTNLERLFLDGCKDKLSPKKSLFSFFSSFFPPRRAGSSTFLPVTFPGLTSLRKLNLGDRNLSDSDISIDFGSFPFLFELNMSGNKFCSLPVGVGNHSYLRLLYVNDCTHLQSIPELPPKLSSFKAERCLSIVTYPKLSDISRNVFSFFITNCSNIDLEGWDLRHWSPRELTTYWLDANELFPFLPCDDGIPLKERASLWKSRYLMAIFPAREVPDWFEYKEMGSSISFPMPPLVNGERSGMYMDMILWVVYGVNEDYDGEAYTYLTVSFKNETKRCWTIDWSGVDALDGIMCEDHAWVNYYLGDHIFQDLEAEEGDEIVISVVEHGRLVVKKCDIYFKNPIPINDSS
ncbi:Chaperonin Cpn60/TCP-1 [Corchorus capsularis]|uniref:T-complex protein 1 subunit eta n=1 Tax=Corchorus capsularis TaxID=210143 RepID=A0A1R3GG73_COCAP|nr:Chaperonin Cpn60/TCP-1 [Corchorus capsularis]